VKTDTLAITENTGWRYARVSGDFNPIHLTARTAKMFGFKQAVAHGMFDGTLSWFGSSRAAVRAYSVDTQFATCVLALASVSSCLARRQWRRHIDAAARHRLHRDSGANVLEPMHVHRPISLSTLLLVPRGIQYTAVLA
jgi:hypothetical protein